MKIALCQINPIIGDIEGNKKRILDGYKKGAADGADLVIFPELALIGYPPLDLVEKKEFRQTVKRASEEIAAETGETGLVFGSITEFEDRVGTNVFNTALFCYEGKIRNNQPKTLIPNYDVFDEVRYFESAEETDIYEFKGSKLGISVCEDIWNDKDYWKNLKYDNDPVEKQVELGADILINISASPYSYGKRMERVEMLSTLTSKDKVKLAYVCCAGAQTDLIFDGASMCFDEKGRLVRLGKTYSEDYFIYDTEVNYDEVKDVEASFEEEVLEALIFGVKDFFKKLGFSRAVIGLSGGMDSAMVTYIAARALGSENVHAVLMPSRFSSEGSIEDSKKLCGNLGIKYDIVPITEVFDTVNKALGPAFQGYKEDVTEENIQARIRGMYLMAFSNKFGSLLLATGNKSELAVGYATLYGDMCGALAVIADVYKTDIYRIARYINRGEEIIPDEIITKPPSAELKPDQVDEDFLPPYEFLDKILQFYLEENKELEEIAEITGDRDTVERVLKLVDANEFKRKQAAPALRVSKKAFGYGRRFPIVHRWSRK